MPDRPGPPPRARRAPRAPLVSRLAWLLLGLVLGAGAATVLARRLADPVPATVVERAALPAPSGRHAWVPPGETAGPSAG